MTPARPRTPGELLAGLFAATEPYLSCDECFDRLDEYVERLVVDPQYRDRAMGVHLSACAACAEEAAALAELVRGDAAL